MVCTRSHVGVHLRAGGEYQRGMHPQTVGERPSACVHEGSSAPEAVTGICRTRGSAAGVRGRRRALRRRGDRPGTRSGRGHPLLKTKVCEPAEAPARETAKGLPRSTVAISRPASSRGRRSRPPRRRWQVAWGGAHHLQQCLRPTTRRRATDGQARLPVTSVARSLLVVMDVEKS